MPQIQLGSLLGGPQNLLRPGEEEIDGNEEDKGRLVRDDNLKAQKKKEKRKKKKNRGSGSLVIDDE